VTPFQPLATERLAIRYLAPRDLPAHLAMRADAAVRQYQSFPRNWSGIDALAFMAWMKTRDPAGGGWFNLCVAERADDRHAGDVACNAKGDAAMIGVSLERRAQGRGYATEALGALLVWLGERGIRQFRAEIDARNARSIALFRDRLGFAPAGRCMDGPVEVLTFARWSSR